MRTVSDSICSSLPFQLEFKCKDKVTHKSLIFLVLKVFSFGAKPELPYKVASPALGKTHKIFESRESNILLMLNTFLMTGPLLTGNYLYSSSSN